MLENLCGIFISRVIKHRPCCLNLIKVIYLHRHLFFYYSLPSTLFFFNLFFYIPSLFICQLCKIFVHMLYCAMVLYGSVCLLKIVDTIMKVDLFSFLLLLWHSFVCIFLILYLSVLVSYANGLHFSDIHWWNLKGYFISNGKIVDNFLCSFSSYFLCLSSCTTFSSWRLLEPLDLWRHFTLSIMGKLMYNMLFLRYQQYYGSSKMNKFFYITRELLLIASYVVLCFSTKKQIIFWCGYCFGWFYPFWKKWWLLWNDVLLKFLCHSILTWILFTVTC